MSHARSFIVGGAIAVAAIVGYYALKNFGKTNGAVSSAMQKFTNNNFQSQNEGYNNAQASGLGYGAPTYLLQQATANVISSLRVGGAKQ